MKVAYLQLIQFSIVGLSNTFISYSIYFCLTFIGVQYIIANVIAFVVGVLNSFFWSSRYVFKKGDGEYRNPFYTLIQTFLAYAGTGLILSNILLFIFVEKLNISKYIAPLLVLAITVPTNYLINKKWAYKIIDRRNNQHADNRF